MTCVDKISKSAGITVQDFIHIEHPAKKKNRTNFFNKSPDNQHFEWCKAISSLGMVVNPTSTRRIFRPQWRKGIFERAQCEKEVGTRESQQPQERYACPFERGQCTTTAMAHGTRSDHPSWKRRCGNGE